MTSGSPITAVRWGRQRQRHQNWGNTGDGTCPFTRCLSTWRTPVRVPVCLSDRVEPETMAPVCALNITDPLSTNTFQSACECKVKKSPDTRNHSHSSWAIAEGLWRVPGWQPPLTSCPRSASQSAPPGHKLHTALRIPPKRPRHCPSERFAPGKSSGGHPDSPPDVTNKETGLETQVPGPRSLQHEDLQAQSPAPTN